MPHVDVETLVSSLIGSTADRKVTCETMAKPDQGSYLPDHDDFSIDADVPPDFPPESFWLSEDAELDWFDRNAALFQRKQSGRGIIHSSTNNQPSSNSNSQRFSTNLKPTAALIIGLPKAQQNYADSKRRINKATTNIHFFPKRSGSIGKSTVSVLEPSSPKVSCIGRVRSKRCHRKKPKEIKKKKSEKSSTTGSSGDDHRKKGFYSRLISIFGGDKRRTTDRSVKNELATVRETMPGMMRMRDFSVDSSEPLAEPPTLGGMKKLVSGRRSGSGMNEFLDVSVGSVQSEMEGSHKTTKF